MCAEDLFFIFGFVFFDLGLGFQEIASDVSLFFLAVACMPEAACSGSASTCAFACISRTG